MKPVNRPPLYYEIRIEGELGDMWADWFDGLSIGTEPGGQRGCPITVLYGPIPDQPALHSILIKIRDLNLTLQSLVTVEPNDTNHCVRGDAQ